MPFGDRRAPEDLDAARAALKAKREVGYACYRQDFLDATTWDELARAYGVRLPQWHQGPTPGQMQRWLKKCGVSTTVYWEYSADKPLSEFARLNPDWPLRAWVGLLLEAIDVGHIASTLKRREPKVEELPIEDAPLFDGRRDRRTGDAVRTEAA